MRDQNGAVLDRLCEFLESRTNAPDQLSSATRRIYESLLRDSPYIDGPNFTTIHETDLERLFEQYDQAFFDGMIRAAIDGRKDRIDFRFSRRMTRTGGKTVQRQYAHAPGCPRAGSREFEIAVSATLLYQTFKDVRRPVVVSGLKCRDRLEALLRIFEHELVHLVEILVWEKSSCRGRRFRSIAGRLFGHTAWHHQLVTPRETAAVQLGLAPGCRVAFENGGVRREGIVNRITRRATVLVPSGDGALYSDGRRYEKWYVPPQCLKRLD